MTSKSIIPFALVLLGLTPLSAQAAGEGGEAEALKDLMELLNTPVVSASNTAEKLSEAPATVIVLTRADLDRRGYTELSQILDDLPGMQLARSYGDYQVKNYWRGYRNYLGDPFLLMLDGLSLNDLYYNAVEFGLVSLPLSNVERIEVVYGPASAVYGANAFMGVINVITVKDRGVDGAHQNLRATGGTSEMRVLDGSAFFKAGAFRISATARLEHSLLDTAHTEDYEYTKAAYTLERRRWGGFVDNPNLSGPTSVNRKRALDVRAFGGETEFGLNYLNLKSGYGTEYAYDLSQGNAVWSRRLLGIHLRHARTLAKDFTTTTTLRYRETGITPDSNFIDAGPYSSTGAWGAAFSWWQTKNSSWAWHQDFDLKTSERLSFNFGLKFEEKDLQKAYDNPYGPYFTPAQWNAKSSNYPYPTPPVDSTQVQNRVQTQDRGLYLQSRIRLSPEQILILGGRFDHNTKYGSANTLRLGYVGNYGSWGFKALYGEGFQEPTPRTLYGGWKGAGSDPNLDPERSKTLEVSGSYTERTFNVLLSGWRVRNTDTIVSAVGRSLNLGTRDITGLDVHAQYLASLPGVKQLKAWGYASHLLKLDGSNRPDPTGAVTMEGLTRDGRVADLAKDQLWAGLTLDFAFPLSATVLARHIGSRDTVASNPVASVDAHATVDVVLVARDFFGLAKGLNLGLRIANATGKGYFHPGLSTAGAGDRPGTWDSAGIWQRQNIDWSTYSADYYSSLLAQPGRTFQLTLGLSY